jgi:hypothetical protein
MTVNFIKGYDGSSYLVSPPHPDNSWDTKDKKEW